MQHVTYENNWLLSGSCRVANPGKRHEKNNAKEPESQNSRTPWRVVSSQPGNGQDQGHCNNTKAELPDISKDGFKQDDLPPAGRERVHERQASDANNFQPKSKHSGNKRCEQNPNGQSKQASFDPTQIVALSNASKAKHYDFESEASCNEN